jgi:predicted TIM-barrel fold metal-dependent hydrolase
MKVTTALLRQSAAAGEPTGLIDRLVALFGADRTLWGSDFPQTSTDYADMVQAGRDSCRNLGQTERDLFLSGTAQRLWWRDGG